MTTGIIIKQEQSTDNFIDGGESNRVVNGSSNKIIAGVTDDAGNFTSRHRHHVPKKPIIINAGRGTTATHLVHAALCRSGFPSVHYWIACVSEEELDQEVVAEMIRPHLRVVSLYEDFVKCLRKRSCAKDVEVWLAETKDAIEQLLASPHIDAIQDSPYVSYMPFMLQKAAEIRGTEPIVVLSERDPQQWVTRRLANHPHHPLCRDIVEGTTSQVDEAIVGPGVGVFDVLGCIVRALENRPGKKVFNLTDIFISSGKLGKLVGGKDRLAGYMGEYQESLQSLASYRINFWERLQTNKAAATAQDVAQEMRTQIPNLPETRGTGLRGTIFSKKQNNRTRF